MGPSNPEVTDGVKMGMKPRVDTRVTVFGQIGYLKRGTKSC